ncbi:hypothetical protein DMA15_00125 [Streptomyces sp. WAC 01529]|uniref:hypothetical protein n=1 Tax=Streptomyces sp. WAC 01529 TaxID=2203205 RepID=UPI000F6BD499|nr:hypothetical protein [Streptomyces sp. WAC 01529]AZM51195.1 hypothetical protein DMA15_00125 [Streptomyces sp. WAC 01529]
MQELWPQLLQAIDERMRFAWILLSQNASVLFYDGSTLTLNMFSPGAYETLINSYCRRVLEEVLAELLSPPPAVELLVQGRIPSPSDLPSPEGPTQVDAPGTVPAADTSAEPDEALTAILYLVLAQTAFLLYEDGNSQAAALLADVEDIEHVPSDRSEEGEDVALIVPLYLVARFTPEVLAAIRPLLVHVAARHDLLVDNVSAIPALPETGDDWRQSLQEKLINKTSPSQYPRPRAEEAAATFSRDGFAFDAREQMLVYEALKRAQAQLPQDSTIAIFPLPRARVGSGSTWVPDFLVTASGRVGAIEVDEPHHHEHFAADAALDRSWRNSGIAHIERIQLKGFSADREVDVLIRQFLTRLHEHH